MPTGPDETARSTGPTDDAEGERGLLSRLRAGDEKAFGELVDRHHAAMVRVARGMVGSVAVAEEVAQEAWVGVLEGLDRFEGRSSLRTWIFRILTNRAISRGERERRTVPFSSLAGAEVEGDGVDADRFVPPDHPRWPGAWAAAPRSWAGEGEERLLADETRRVIEDAIRALPPAQRTVITMRDIEGFDSDDVCNVLDITETNQRVLLHRARSKVRAALQAYLDGQQDAEAS